jgi:hypothetical protein
MFSPTNNSSSDQFFARFFDESLDLNQNKTAKLSLIEYLQEFGLLRKSRSCKKCQNSMALKWISAKGNWFWRCGAKSCQTFASVREGSEFFAFEGNKNKLSLYKIFRQLEFFLKGNYFCR